MAVYEVLNDIATLPILVLADIIKVMVLALTPSFLKPKKDIKNDIVLITGGGSGFGQSMAVKLARMGCKIVIWDVDAKGSTETERLVQEVNGSLRKYILDVSIKEDVYRMAQQVERDVGPVTILINNAGIAYNAPFLNTPDAVFEKMMAVNNMAHVWTMKAFLPSMMDNNKGHIVCVASLAGLASCEELGAYCSSKHAVVGLMSSLKMDLLAAGKTGVKTTLVLPSISATPLYEGTYTGVVPLLTQDHVSSEIVNGILTNKEVLYLPKIASILAMIVNVFLSKGMFFRVYRAFAGRTIFQTLKIKTVFKEQSEKQA